MRPLALAVLLPLTALASPLASRALAGTRPPARPRLAACPALPAPSGALSFRPGEELDFSLDAMGAQAGKLSLKVLPEKGGLIPVRAQVSSNTFFSKIRRARGVATTYLNPKTLHPTRYEEDSTENDVHRTADVRFSRAQRVVNIHFTVNGAPGRRTLRTAPDALDAASAIYLMRQLPLRQDTQFCFDSYGIRTVWRVTGKVVGREHISLPLGEFDAWHLDGQAVRVDNPSQHRDLHIWVSDDARRLPLVAVGAIDLGAVRATLTRYNRPGEKPRAAHAEAARDLTW